MVENIGAAGTTGAENGAIVEPTMASFRVEVVAESSRRPVIVAFWSKASTDSLAVVRKLEKLARSANGKIRLAKVDVDLYPDVPAQLGVQAIPAAIVFQKGQPLDGFSGDLSERLIKAFLERQIGPIGGELDDLVAEADSRLIGDDAPGAAQLFSEALAIDAQDIKSIAGLAKAKIMMGELDEARSILATAPRGSETSGPIAATRAALDLAAQAESVGEFNELEKIVATEPKNHQARFDLAVAYNAAGKKEQAADELLEIVRRDRNWNDDAARKQLLQLFEAWGHMEPETLAARRKLSTLLYS